MPESHQTREDVPGAPEPSRPGFCGGSRKSPPTLNAAVFRGLVGSSDGARQAWHALQHPAVTAIATYNAAMGRRFQFCRQRNEQLKRICFWMKPEQWGQDPKGRSGRTGCLLSLKELVVLVLVWWVIAAFFASFSPGADSWNSPLRLILLGVMAGLVVVDGITLRTWWWPAVASAPAFLLALWESLEPFGEVSGGIVATIVAGGLVIVAAGGLGVGIGKRRGRAWSSDYEPETAHDSKL